MDERITANEWTNAKRCPICEDIAEKNIDLEGEIMTHPHTGEVLKCPICGHADTRLFHEVGGIEISRTSDRGDTQPWTHVLTVKCMSCKWKHTVSNEVCLGNPWDEVMGFNRKLDQSEQQEHAIQWTQEQAVGLRGAHDRYNPEDKLLGSKHKHKREIKTEKTLDGKSKIEWKPSAEEKKLPRFSDSGKDNL